MKIMGKAFLLALLTGGLTAVILFVMDNAYAQQAVLKLTSLPGGLELEEKDKTSTADKADTEKNSIQKTGTEKITAAPSVETGRQQIVYQTQNGISQMKAAGSRNGSTKAEAQQGVQTDLQQAAQTDPQQSMQKNTDRQAVQTDSQQSMQKNTDRQAGRTQKKRQKQKVGEDYFSDAVFIGDSRTVGMQQSHLLPEAAYYAKVGIGIGRILTQRFISEGGAMLTLEEALRRHSFGKVYIMIGINDMSSGDTEWFTEKYREILDVVQRTQPDAVIYIQGNIPMGYNTQDMSGSLNNGNLRLRNEASRQLADNSKIFYLETEDIYADANGNLNTYFSSDGLHVSPKYYPLWVDYLQHHAVICE